MDPKANKRIRDDLSPEGRALLKLIVGRIAAPGFTAGDPSTYLGYKECCVELGLATADADAQWGHLLQSHSLSDLNRWTAQHELPRLTGLIVNQSGDRKFWPGGDYFKSNGQQDMDCSWWTKQATDAARIDWRPFI